MSMDNQNSKISIQLDHLPITIRSYWLLVSLEGFFVLNFLLSIPSESSISTLAGISTERWLMVLAIGLVATVFLGLVLFSLIFPNWLDRFSILFRKVLSRRYITAGLYLLSIAAIIGGLQFLFLAFEVTEPYTEALMVRLSPLVVWAVLLGVQTLIFLPLTIGGINLSNLNVTIQRFLPLIIIFIVLAFMTGFIALTGMGIDPSDAGIGWNALGTPILGWQVILGWVLSMIALGIGMFMVNRRGRISKIWRSIRVDILITVIVWAAAFFVWSAIPLTPSWFVGQVRQPNFEYYPNSDATIYDVPAQSVLAGEGYQIRSGPLSIRPLYVFFLSLIHGIGGLGYEEVINYQIAFLALLPVGLFWVTRGLHNRITGILVSSLVVMREANAIALNQHITNSNAKLLMSDLPATLGVVGFTLIVVYWYQRKTRHLWMPILGGGVLGATMLIRPEMGSLLPAAILIAVLVFRRERKYWIGSSIAMIIGLLAMITPWLIRNYQQLGVVSLHHPDMRTQLVVERYLDASDQTPQTTPAVATPQLSPQNELEEGVQAQPASTPQPTQDLDRVTEFVIENPGMVALFMGNHFLNNQVQTILYLPGTSRFINNLIAFTGHQEPGRFFKNCCGLVSYVRWLPYWKQWTGHIPAHALSPILWSLVMVGIGLYTSWENKKWVGLVPLAFGLSHSAINALFRNSGGRYVLPVDWIGVFYYSIGIIQVTLWAIAFVRNQQMKSIVLGHRKPEITEPLRKTKPIHYHWRDIAIIIGILVVGISVPLAETLVPQRYTPALLDSRLESLMETGEVGLPVEIKEPMQTLLESGGQVWQGRALYPRFYRMGVGASGSTWPSLSPRSYPRLNFILVSESNSGVVLPMEDPPDYFPHGSDVVIFGCSNQGMIEAWEISVYDENGNLAANYLREPLSDQISCSSP